MKNEVIKVVIRKKEGVEWEGEADNLSSTNEIGPFDILPEHAHFVGLVEQYIIVRVKGKEKKWEIDRGIISVIDNVVEAYLSY